MKPHLVIGLGNPLMGDEGIGWHAIERLAADPRLPEDVELLWGGTDLLSCIAKIEGRSRITLIDALLDPDHVGDVEIFGEGLEGLEDRQGHAHHLSLTQAIRLLRIDSPSFAAARLWLIAICVSSASVRQELSPALAAKIPQLLERIIQEIQTIQARG
jgi:hydrogenase maturation protease